MVKKLSSSVLLYDQRNSEILLIGFIFLLASVFALASGVADIWGLSIAFGASIGILFFIPWRECALFDISKGTVSIMSQTLRTKKSTREYQLADIREIGLSGNKSLAPAETKTYLTYEIILYSVSGTPLPLFRVNSSQWLPFGHVKMDSPGVPSKYPEHIASQARKIAEFIGVPYRKEILGL